MEELRLRGFSMLRLAFHKVRETQIVNAANHCVCVTEGIRDQLIRDFQVAEKNCSVISNAADTELFQPLTQKECQQNLGLPQDKFHLGFVGTFQEWVDFDILFSSLIILRDQGIPIYCTLVGDGSLEPYLRHQVQKFALSDIVLFAGRQDQTEIPKWMGAFDVGIAPFKEARNKTIGLSPLKLFEYMACERPVIATALPGIIKPVEAAQAGLLYSIGDQGSMAQQFLWLYQNPDSRILMGKRGREYVLKHHSWAGVAEKIERIMEEVCQPGQARTSMKSQL
jgi:glycosyltransferase involved in cell wall biosynthesis